jgi:parvulin-like peptidyl-prolyl isomerase
MKKKGFGMLPLLLAAIIGLMSAGCSMSSMDIVVGRVGPDNVTVRDVTLYANYMLLSNGYSRSDLTAEEIAGLNGAALEYAVTRKMILQKAASLGLYPLSAENQQKADESYYSYMVSVLTSGADIESAGLTGDDIRTMMTYFTVSDVLLAETTKDVTVTDEEIQAEYDRRLSSQQSSYDAYPTAYDSALSGGSTAIVYRPAGYRYIKHILIAMPEDIASQIEAATSSGDKQKVAELRKQGLPQIEAKANEVLAKVNNGGDFDALMAEYGADPGMQAEPAKTAGYQVGEKSSYVPEFLEAAMGLENAGDTTGLIATDFGYHILKYVGAVPSGAVALSEVRDSIRADVLETKQSDAFDKLVEQWKTEIKIKRNAAKIP